MMTNSKTLFLAVALIWSAFGWIGAQTLEPSTQNPTPAQLVTLSLIVTDKSNHSVDDVDRDELQVFDDGKPQQPYSLTRETKRVKYVIAIDASLSFKNLLVPSLEACKLVIGNNGPDDETALIRFVSSDKITRVQDFTSDQSRLADALSSLYIEGGQSAVIDALYLGVQTVASYKAPEFTGRRAVVLFTDGEDRRSFYNTEALVKLLRENSVQIFVIGITAQLNDDARPRGLSQKQKAEELLSRLARESGGRVFFARDVKELPAAAQEITHDLHTQFTISYRVLEHQAKNFHKVELKTVGPKKLKALTRPGYLDNDKNSASKTKEKEKRSP